MRSTFWNITKHLIYFFSFKKYFLSFESANKRTLGVIGIGIMPLTLTIYEWFIMLNSPSTLYTIYECFFYGIFHLLFPYLMTTCIFTLWYVDPTQCIWIFSLMVCKSYCLNFNYHNWGLSDSLISSLLVGCNTAKLVCHLCACMCERL